ncbi:MULTISPECIES: hypothetical protein [Microcoleaceae]|nr:hypothetical protein [Tychonema sp. LEGE 06208]MBE9164888.1 hypothetical protein [Tychonema sp. LEGE 06208]
MSNPVQSARSNFSPLSLIPLRSLRLYLLDIKSGVAEYKYEFKISQLL